jgi:hypothetical protein
MTAAEISTAAGLPESVKKVSNSREIRNVQHEHQMPDARCQKQYGSHRVFAEFAKNRQTSEKFVKKRQY